MTNETPRTIIADSRAWHRMADGIHYQAKRGGERVTLQDLKATYGSLQSCEITQVYSERGTR